MIKLVVCSCTFISRTVNVGWFNKDLRNYKNVCNQIKHTVFVHYCDLLVYTIAWYCIKVSTSKYSSSLFLKRPLKFRKCSFLDQTVEGSVQEAQMMFRAESPPLNSFPVTSTKTIKYGLTVSRRGRCSLGEQVRRFLKILHKDKKHKGTVFFFPT